jgi:hypothetical protein
MKNRIPFTLTLFLLQICYFFPVEAQKSLMVEKIGTPTRYFYKKGDYIKLKVIDGDSVIKGKLWDIDDSVISIEGFHPFDLKINNIGFVFKQYSFPKKLSKYLGIFSAVIFGAITVNHLINNEQVFTPDMLIISGAFAGGSLISFAFSERRCKIGNRWKIKIMDIKVY